MRLTMLGTGNAMPEACYNTCYVLEEGDFCLLVDAGGGYEIRRRLQAAHIDLKDIHHVFVTHKHLDHLMGVVWVMRIVLQMMVRGAYKGDLTIYAHDEVTEILSFLSKRLYNEAEVALVGTRLRLREVVDGETIELSGHSLTFFDIHSTKAKQFGYTLSLRDGRSLVCLGDEPITDAGRPYAQGASWMLAEAFCQEADKDLFRPHEKHHSTVTDAAREAQALGIENLVLYHMEDTHLVGRADRVTEEAARVFCGRTFSPYDLDTIEID